MLQLFLNLTPGEESVRLDLSALTKYNLGRRKLVGVLESNESWDRSSPTVIVAEGLLQYLPAEGVRDLFGQCASVAGVDSRIAFTYIPTGADGRPDAGRWTGLVLWIPKVGGGPWLWSIRPKELGKFLKETGWTNALGLAGSADRHGVELYAVVTK